MGRRLHDVYAKHLNANPYCICKQREITVTYSLQKSDLNEHSRPRQPHRKLKLYADRRALETNNQLSYLNAKSKSEKERKKV